MGIYSKTHRIVVARLKQCRLASGLSQAQAAQKLGKTQSYLSKLEAGQIKIDIATLADMAKLYRKSIVYFVEGIEDES